MEKQCGNHKHPDVIVVGGGIIGLASAWKLGTKGLNVLLLEQNAAIPGASQCSLGVIAAPSPFSQNLFNILHRKSLYMIPRFAEELQEASGIDICFRRIGSLELIPSEAQLAQAKREIAFLNSGEIPDPNTPKLFLLSQTEASEREPNAQIPEFGALHSPFTGHVSVERTIEALTVACNRNNVEVINNYRVSDLAIVSDKVTGIYSNQGSIQSAAVVVATGAWTSELGSEVDEFAHMDPVRGQAILVKPQTPLIQSVVKWKKRYLVPRSDGTVALGSTTEKRSGFDVSTTVEGIRDILSFTSEAVPLVSSTKIEKTWAGLRPIGRDSKPHIGQIPGIEGLFVATGHYKVGFGYLPLTANSISDLVSGVEPDIDISGIAPRQAEPTKKKRRMSNGQRNRP